MYRQRNMCVDIKKLFIIVFKRMLQTNLKMKLTYKIDKTENFTQDEKINFIELLKEQNTSWQSFFKKINLCPYICIAYDNNNVIDSDQDGLSDDREKKLGTDPNNVDSDDDGLFDREEVEIYETDPLNADSDNDGFLDGEEVRQGNNPDGAGRLYEIPDIGGWFKSCAWYTASRQRPGRFIRYWRG